MFIGQGFVDFWYDHWLFNVPLMNLLHKVVLPHMLLADFYLEQGWNSQKLGEWVSENIAKVISQLHLYSVFFFNFKGFLY